VKPMKITILTIGSRGDVQPFVALGRGLQAAGHSVVLATHEEFRGFVTEHDLEFKVYALFPLSLLPSILSRSPSVFSFLLCFFFALCPCAPL
jgi:sterol 3beta-glucosyltransferase